MVSLSKKLRVTPVTPKTGLGSIESAQRRVSSTQLSVAILVRDSRSSGLCYDIPRAVALGSRELSQACLSLLQLLHLSLHF